jgi:hypothetical protein
LSGYCIALLGLKNSLFTEGFLLRLPEFCKMAVLWDVKKKFYSVTSWEIREYDQRQSVSESNGKFGHISIFFHSMFLQFL